MKPDFKIPMDKQDYWTYQVFIHKNVFGEGGKFYAVHEVNYYKGKLQCITPRPVNNAYYDSLEEMFKDLNKLVTDISLLPTVEYEERDEHLGKGTTH